MVNSLIKLSPLRYLASSLIRWLDTFNILPLFLNGKFKSYFITSGINADKTLFSRVIRLKSYCARFDSDRLRGGQTIDETFEVILPHLPCSFLFVWLCINPFQEIFGEYPAFGKLFRRRDSLILRSR